MSAADSPIGCAITLTGAHAAELGSGGQPMTIDGQSVSADGTGMFWASEPFETAYAPADVDGRAIEYAISTLEDSAGCGFARLFGGAFGESVRAQYTEALNTFFWTATSAPIGQPGLVGLKVVGNDVLVYLDGVLSYTATDALLGADAIVITTLGSGGTAAAIRTNGADYAYTYDGATDWCGNPL